MRFRIWQLLVVTQIVAIAVWASLFVGVQKVHLKVADSSFYTDPNGINFAKVRVVVTAPAQLTRQSYVYFLATQNDSLIQRLAEESTFVVQFRSTSSGDPLGDSIQSRLGIQDREIEEVVREFGRVENGPSPPETRQ